MICEKCKHNNALFHSTKTQNGFLVEEHLCVECAKENGSIVSNSQNEPSLKACPFCDRSWQDFLTCGLVGCVECYHAFAEDIKSIIAKCQNNETKHIGKTPKKNGDDDE